MTDRERLVELIRGKTCGNNACIPFLDCEKCGNFPLADKDVDRLANHILADGWMRPPCKVGTTVYCIIDGFDTVAEGRVRFYTVHKDSIIYEVAINGYYAQQYTNKDFGYKIFFTREEAEKALRGGESDA